MKNEKTDDSFDFAKNRINFDFDDPSRDLEPQFSGAVASAVCKRRQEGNYHAFAIRAVPVEVYPPTCYRREAHRC